MTRLLIAVLLLLVTVPGLCQSKEKPCWKTAKTQMEINRCAESDASKADAELNHIFQQLLSKAKGDDNAIKKLHAAQRAWVAFRDAELQALFPAEDKQAEYGSMFPMCYAQEYATMTRERTALLRKMLKGGDSC